MTDKVITSNAVTVADAVKDIIRIAKPVRKMSDTMIAHLLTAMMHSDGAIVVPGVPAGHAALVHAPNGRSTAVFGSEADVRSFAKTFGLKTIPRIQGN